MKTKSQKEVISLPMYSCTQNENEIIELILLQMQRLSLEGVHKLGNELEKLRDNQTVLA